MRWEPSKALQPRFFGGSSGSSSTRSISSTSSWPTSPIHSSPSAASKAKRQGLRRPVSTTSQRGFGSRTSAARILPSLFAGVLGRAVGVEGAAAVAEPEVEAPVGAEQELAAVVVLLGLVDVEQLAQRLGVQRAVVAGLELRHARVALRVRPVQVDAAVRREVGVEGDPEQALLGAEQEPVAEVERDRAALAVEADDAAGLLRHPQRVVAGRPGRPRSAG